MSNDALDGLSREIKMYDGRVFGHEVSVYGLESGYLDYDTLGRIVGSRVLNNNVMGFAGYDDWDLINGDDEEIDPYQFYIITESGYWILENFTDELVYYHEELDMYIWAITHFGTSWDLKIRNSSSMWEMILSQLSLLIVGVGTRRKIL